MNDLFISIEYNDREFEGIDEFKNELKKDYHFQLRPKWIPTCSEGAEFWMTIYVNSELVSFLVSAVTDGMIWDLIKVGTKKYVFTPIFQALERLNTKNEQNWNGLSILKFKFQFDDCEIYVGGLNKNFTSIMSSVFREIAKKKPWFEKQIGQEVIKIELPIEKYDREYLSESQKYMIKTFNEDYSIKVFLKLWKITFSTDFPIAIYNFDVDSLTEL